MKILADLIWTVRRSLRRHGVVTTAKLCAMHLRGLALSRSAVVIEGAHEELEFDQRFGVQTIAEAVPKRVTVDGEGLDHGNRYGTILPSQFRQLLGQVKVRYEDFTFIDLGSGKGRVLLLASEHPFGEIIGVEYGLELHQIAVANAQTFNNPAQRCRSITLHHKDAAEFEFPPTPIVLFMFNPFDQHIMAQVM